MILNGKAKEDFLEYYNNHSIKYLLSWTDFDDLPVVVQNSLIIEWFDSVDRINFQELYLETFKDNFLMYHITSIQEEAIKKANEIYNKN